MKLLLTSSGITNSTIAKALSDLLGKPFEKSAVTFIPTAANVEPGDKKFVVNDMYNVMKLGFKTFDVMDISAISKDYWLPSFRAADVLVVGGGNDRHLLTWLNKSGVALELPELLKTKVYMGISAGSIVAAKKVSLSVLGILYYERTKKFKDDAGLGLVDFEIRPHLNSEWFPQVTLSNLAKIAPQHRGSFYAIDDATAIKVDGENITVVSEGKWKKFH